MSLYKKDIAKAIIVVSLVAVLSIGTYFLFPEVLPKVMYVAGATIQDDASATEDFIAGIRESGGAYISIALNPWITLMFENGTEYYFTGLFLKDFDWMGRPKTLFNLTTDRPPLPVKITKITGKQLEINASELQEFNISWGEGWTWAHSESENKSGKYGAPGWVFSGEMRVEGPTEYVRIAGNFSWHGNYNKGSEINTTLNVDSTTTDLGTHYENNYLIDFNLDSTWWDSYSYSRVVTQVNSSRSELVFWDTGSYWGTSGQSIVLPNGTSIYQPYGCWSIQTDQLSQMVGQFESASISFEGTLWIDGNYTFTENGNARDATMNVAKNVSFGTVDVTFENGAISTLSFDFNPIEIVLFAYPQED